jgi:predicted type IV restriction endonuclease
VPLVVKAAGQFLNEQVNDRLKNALGGPDSYVSVSSGVAEESEPVVEERPVDASGDVITTEDEIEGYRIVRAIVCSEVPVSRVVARDTKTYCGVLLDDNNRKPIARLWFNRAKRYLGVFDENKAETRIPLDDVQDIYQYAGVLRQTVARYLVKVEEPPPAPVLVVD